MSSADARVRRPERHEVLIQTLLTEARFPAMRDVLLFAAALGYSANRRVPFDKPGEPIRYEILTNEAQADAFVSMLAAVTMPDDPEILDATRLGERIAIFEEYANGGLEFLQEQINTQRKPYDVIVKSLTVDALTDAGGVEGASVQDLLESF